MVIGLAYVNGLAYVYGLAGIAVLGWWLDLMILEVFSNLNDSMILWLYDSMRGSEDAAQREKPPWQI